jgi:hypothetical protein
MVNKSWIAAVCGVVLTVSLAAVPAASAAEAPSAHRCADMARLHVPHATVTSATVNTTGAFTIPPGQGGLGEGKPGDVIDALPAYCDVEITQGRVGIGLWLPLDWNGRFEGVGGGGFVSGISWRAMGDALRSGYATASTDTGHPDAQGQDGSFALAADGTLDLPVIRDFAYLAVHEMTVTGKSVTTSFYGRAPRYMYFEGCSMGGRQALAEAQRYPSDYDGIAAGSTAVRFPRLSAMQLWPQFVMLRAHDFLPPCKFTAFQQAVIAKCDGLDKVRDGVIADLTACRFDPRTLIGTPTDCGVITATDASVMRQIWAGPRTGAHGNGRRLWYGPPYGFDASFLAHTNVGADGDVTGYPLYIASGWYRYWLARDKDFDWKSLTTKSYLRMFREGVATFPTLESDDPDLTAFRDHGGKLLLWTGLADPLIPPQGTVAYYRSVVRHMGGLQRTERFARLFLAPGVGHCAGTGTVAPAPRDRMGPLARWVEHGTAPASLLATTVDKATGQVTASRPVCVYPLVARYDGTGDTEDARNFTCARRY